MKKTLIAIALGAVAVVVGTSVHNADAADHLDPNDRVAAGDAADIADLYAWHDGGRVRTILTFAGPVPAGTDAAFDRNVLYSIHIDGDDDNLDPDISIQARFAQNGAGDWGVWVQNVPGADADVVGAIDTNMTSGDAMVFAGQTDDPFFFDLQGFGEVLTSADLSDFDPSRDFFAGQNINAIAIEFPASALGITGPYNMWATTGVAN